MFASSNPHTLLLSLLSLTLACGPDSEGTATDTDATGATEPGPTTGATEPSTGATEPSTGATEPTTGATEPTTGDTTVDTTGDTDATDTETTGAPVFPMCEEPTGPDNIGFEMSGEGLPLGVELNLECTIISTQTSPEMTATIDLSCTDGMVLEVEVTIDLQLAYEPNLGDLGATKVRLRHRKIDSFEQREVLALHDFDNDDVLLLFAARGYDIFTIEDKALWAPLQITPVAEALCATEGECEQVTRSALDITLDEITERVFDRDFFSFGPPGPSVHVGSARVIDLYALPECDPGDGADGFETNLVVIAEQ